MRRLLLFFLPCILSAQSAPVLDGEIAIDRALQKIRLEKRVQQLIRQDALQAQAIRKDQAAALQKKAPPGPRARIALIDYEGLKKTAYPR